MASECCVFEFLRCNVDKALATSLELNRQPLNFYPECGKLPLWQILKIESSWFSLTDNLWRLDTVMCFFYQTYSCFVMLFRDRLSYPSQQPFQQSSSWRDRVRKGLGGVLWGEDADHVGHESRRSRQIRWKTWMWHQLFKCLFIYQTAPRNNWPCG